MKILYTPISKLVHRVQIVARELGIEKEIEWIPTQPYESPAHLLQHNPLSKVPTLVTDQGLALFPGHIIYEYLEGIAGPKLYPLELKNRWKALHLLSLGEGLWDMVVLWNNEQKRPQENQWMPQIERYTSAISRILDSLELIISEDSIFNVGHISVAGTLSFLDLCNERYGEEPNIDSKFFDFRNKRPNLSGWYVEINKRSSFNLTAS